MDDRKILSSHDPIITQLLKTIGAPERVTEFHIYGKGNDCVNVELTFYASLPKNYVTPLLVTKKYKLVEFDDG